MTARTETARPRRLSKTDTAYEAVKARILDGTYPAGFRLGLSTLAEEFGMSPLPVREAIRRLEAESLVRFERNIGATVAGMSLHEYAWTIETLAYLEGAAVGASGHLLTKGELKAARKLNRRLADCLDDEDHRMFRTLDQRFHEALVARCENPTIVELLARSWGRLGTSRRMSPERARRCVAEHDRIVDLLEGGASSTQVERAVRRHHLKMRDSVQEEIDAQQ